MKAIILKEHYQRLRNSPEKLNIYGFVRENENVVNILQVEKAELAYPPKIGDLRDKEESLPLLVTNHGRLELYYRKPNGLTPLEFEVIDLEDSFKRTPFPKKLLNKLNSSCVLIFGLGSGGGRLATCLARDNLGAFKLVDPDRFSIENLRRHECDLSDLGRYKVHGVKERIQRISPSSTVTCYPFDPFQEGGINELFQGVDLVIGATDRTEVQLQINNQAGKRRVPAVFGGCYEEARGGEVLFTLPEEEETPCLECLRGTIEQPEKLGSIDYSTAQSPEDYEGEPGLYSAISLVTDIEEQVALALLLREEGAKLSQLIRDKPNWLLIGGALAQDFYLFKRPFHITYARFKPHPRCSTCNPSSLSDEGKRRIEEDQGKREEIPEKLKGFL